MNVALAVANSDVLVLTDVRQRLDPACVRSLAETMHDPKVGVVSGDLLILAGESSEEANVGLYRRYESWIRKNLSLADSVLGATGAIYAIRSKLAHPLPRVVFWTMSGYRCRRFLPALDPFGMARNRLGFPYCFKGRVHPEGADTSRCFPAVVATAGLFSSHNRLRWRFFVLKFGRLLMPEVLLICFLVSFWLPVPLRWFILTGQLLFYALAMLDVYVTEHSLLKRLTAPIRAFVVLLAAARAGYPFSLTRPASLWKRTNVRTPRHDQPSSSDGNTFKATIIISHPAILTVSK